MQGLWQAELDSDAGELHLSHTHTQHVTLILNQAAVIGSFTVLTVTSIEYAQGTHPCHDGKCPGSLSWYHFNRSA